MASKFSRGGPSLSGASPFRSSDGLVPRSVLSYGETHLPMDSINGDLEDGINDLRDQVRQLKKVAEQIGSEAKYQNSFLDQLQIMAIKAQTRVKNSSMKLNMRVIRNGGNHILHVVVFALFCFLVVYLWLKVTRR